MDSFNYTVSSLFTFDSVMYIDAAYLAFCFDTYKEPKFIKYFNPNVLKASDATLKNYILASNDDNPLNVLFIEDMELDKLYNNITKSFYKTLMKYIEPNDVFKLILTYMNIEDKAVRCAIYCENEEQEEKINSFKKGIKIEKSNSMDNYDCLFVRSTKELRKFKKLEGKSLYIENFAFNYNGNLVNIEERYRNINFIKTLDPFIDVRLTRRK